LISDHSQLKNRGKVFQPVIFIEERVVFIEESEAESRCHDDVRQTDKV
jgi:hypothetical protein